MKIKSLVKCIILVAIGATFVSCDMLVNLLPTVPRDPRGSKWRIFREVKNDTSQTLELKFHHRRTTDGTLLWHYECSVEVGESEIIPLMAGYRPQQGESPDWQTLVEWNTFYYGDDFCDYVICDGNGNAVYELNYDVLMNASLWSDYRMSYAIPEEGDYMHNLPSKSSIPHWDDTSGYYTYFYFTLTLTDEMLAEWAKHENVGQ